MRTFHVLHHSYDHRLSIMGEELSIDACLPLPHKDVPYTAVDDHTQLIQTATGP